MTHSTLCTTRFSLRLRLLLTLLLLSMSRAVALPVDTLTLLHINDTHSALAAGGARDSTLRATVGGIARFATVVAETRATTENVLVLHAGDVFIGDLFFNSFFGVPELRLLQMIGLDAMVLGNHEFDLTPSILTTALDSGFVAGAIPILCANVDLSDSTLEPLRRFVAPSLVRTVGGHRVGIVGVTTPEANLLSQPAPAVIDERIGEIVAAEAARLRAEGCNAVILLSHLGITGDREVAANVPGIDLIVGAHDHLLLTLPQMVTGPDGRIVPIVQAGANYEAVGRMRLEIGDSTLRMLDYRAIPLDTTVAEEPTVAAVVESLITDIESLYGPVYSGKIAEVTEDFREEATDLTGEGVKSTSIGNLVTDALRAGTGATIAVEPGGGTARTLLRGPIVAADLFRVVGYGFNTVNGLGYRVVSFDISGADLVRGLEVGLSTIEQNDEFLLQVSGVNYSYDPTRPAGARVTGVQVGSLPLDTAALYRVAASEFVLALLGNFGVTASSMAYHNDLTEFQMLAGYVAGLGGTLAPSDDARIRSSRSAGAGREMTPRIEATITPNPATTSSILRLHLPQTDNVRIELLDLHGNPVTFLFTGTLDEGAHTIALNLEGRESGVYICRVAGRHGSTLRILTLTR